MDTEAVKKYYADPQQKEYFIDNLKEDKLYDELYTKCTITKGKKMPVEKFLELKSN